LSGSIHISGLGYVDEARTSSEVGDKARERGWRVTERAVTGEEKGKMG
jgi:hypothetical protein